MRGTATCDPPPLPYVMVNGTADPMMPYGGGRIGLRQGGGPVWGAEQTAAYLARVDGCGGAPTNEALPIGGHGRDLRTRIAWAGCKPGTSVTLIRVENGGHTIPGGAHARNPSFGATNQDFSAAEAILDIFAGGSCRGTGVVPPCDARLPSRDPGPDFDPQEPHDSARVPIPKREIHRLDLGIAGHLGAQLTVGIFATSATTLTTLPAAGWFCCASGAIRITLPSQVICS